MNTTLSEFLQTPGGKVALLAFAVWTAIWKGLSLWKAARREEKGWFIALLVINTLGILEILYLYVFTRPKSEKPVQSTPSNAL